MERKTMEPVQGVLFDLGNVLVHIQTDAVWTDLGMDAEDRKRFLPAVHEAVMILERGSIPPDEFFDRLVAACGSRFTRSAIERAFTSIIREPIEGMDEIVGRVSKRCRTALVSNTNQIHYDYSLRTVPAMSHLHEHFVSFRMGVMKPAAGFYDHIANHIGVPRSALLFIDDMKENVDAAVSAGMQGHQFTSTRRLLAHLEQLKIL